MSSRRGQGRSKQVEPQPLSSDELTNLKATEFARLNRQTGWRLAWLVVSSCEHGSAGRPTKSVTGDQLPDRLSLSQFAKLAGVGKTTVIYYYRAWNFAYEDGTAPCSAEDVPTMVEWIDGHIEPPDEFCLDDDDLAHPWSFYFDWAKTGERPNPKRYDEDEDESESSESQQDSNDVDDESDSVDDDFGMDDFTESEATEADSSIQRNELLELLESIRAVQARLGNVGEIQGDNDSYIGQIASAALDLNSTANALVVKAEQEV